MTRHTISRSIVFAAALLTGAAPAVAQQTNPSAASAGMAGSYTVMARGLSSMYWNPAGLGMPGSPGFSISVLPVRGTAGLDPISLADIAEYDDTIIPNDVKQEWLDEIIAEGSQQGNGGLGLTYLALNVGRFGFQVGTSTVAAVDIDPGIARLLLFGNADGDTAIAVTGENNDLNFGVVSTAAFSYAHPLTLSLGPLPDQHFAVGVTAKYIIGHGLVSGFDNGSRADVDPLEVQVRFPTIISHTEPCDTISDSPFAESCEPGDTLDDESEWNKGSGLGLDVGVMWQGGIFAGGVSIQNVVNTFAWNEDDMWYTPGEVLFNEDTTVTDFETRPLSDAPDELRERLDDLAFSPTLALAGAVRLPMVTVTGEVRQRIGESLSLEPGTHAGVGAEFRPLPFLPIRAGVAMLSGGFNLGAGLGLELGVFNLNLAGNRRSSDLGTDFVGALTVSFGGI